MGDAPSTMMLERTEPNLLERAATLAAWTLAGAMFLTVGWFAMEPDDPLGPVCVYARHGGWMMLVQAAALAGVAAALATVLAGRRVVDIGTFAAAFGLAVVALRGSTTEELLVSGADLSDTFQRGLALRFAVEAVGWFLVVAVAVVVSAVVMNWCFGKSDDAGLSRRDHGQVFYSPLHAGSDIPRLSEWFSKGRGEEPTSVAIGIQHTLITVAVTLAAFGVLSAGLRSRSIQHGQVCFVVAAAVGIGTYSAYRINPVRSALWAILSVGIAAVAGYVWAAVRPVTSGLPATIPSSHFLRILPIQFISVGTAAAVATFWSVQVPVTRRYADHAPDVRPSSGRSGV